MGACHPFRRDALPGPSCRLAGTLRRRRRRCVLVKLDPGATRASSRASGPLRFPSGSGRKSSPSGSIRSEQDRIARLRRRQPRLAMEAKIVRAEG